MFAAVDVLWPYQFTLLCIWACTTVSGFIYAWQCQSVSLRNYIFSLSLTVLTLSSRLFIQEHSHLSILSSSEGWPVRRTITITKFENNSVSAWWNLMWTTQYMIGCFACLSGLFHQSCTLHYHLNIFDFCTSAKNVFQELFKCTCSNGNWLFSMRNPQSW